MGPVYWTHLLITVLCSFTKTLKLDLCLDLDLKKLFSRTLRDISTRRFLMFNHEKLKVSQQSIQFCIGQGQDKGQV